VRVPPTFGTVVAILAKKLVNAKALVLKYPAEGATAVVVLGLWYPERPRLSTGGGDEDDDDEL
jgi:hypothetical protein